MTLLEDSIARMQALKAGDPVTNICAGENNPCLHSVFVAYVVKSRKNKWGIVHREHLAKCKDKNRHISNTDIKVIYPGHLNAETRARLFEPVWQERYGKPATQPQATGAEEISARL